MPHRFVRELTEREQIEDVYRLADKQLRANRQGSLYLQMRLADRTGAFTGLLWNVNEQSAARFSTGDYVHVSGTTQVYNGALQMIVTRCARVPAEEVPQDDYLDERSAETAMRAVRLREIVSQMQNVALRAIAEAVLDDETLMGQMGRAPAGVRLHHAWPGGLLGHTLDLLELALVVTPRYPSVDQDLVLTGLLFHDLGKTAELSYEQEFSYTDAGQLIGHIVLGTRLLDEKVRVASEKLGEPIPDDLHLRLTHIVVSHHGTLENGSPRLPMTLEAILVHQLDTLDSQLAAAQDLIAQDAGGDPAWTVFVPTLERRLYKGGSSRR